MDHGFVTVVMPFEAVWASEVETLIGRALGNPMHPRVAERLGERAVVHFMSLLVVPAEQGGPAHLLLEASVDGTAEAGIDAIAEALEPQLGEVLKKAHIAGPGSLRDQLLGHLLVLGQAWWETPGLPFAGTPGLPCRRIIREAALARRLGDILRQLPDGLALFDRLQAARNALWLDGDSKWAFAPEAAPCLKAAPDSGLTPLVRGFFGDAIPDRSFDALAAMRTGACIALEFLATIGWPFLLMAVVLVVAAARFMSAIDALVFVGALLGVLAVLVVLRLRRLEIRNTPEDEEPASPDVEAVMRGEGYAAQNLLFSVSRLQPGLLRRFALRFSFFSVGLVKYFCRPGFLGANRVIHFARWLVVPGTRQMVFLSNYDGSWQGYVGDFVINTAGAKGVTSIWSNCLGFPRTRNLYDDGAADRDRLVRWARRQQRPVHGWYTAYAGLTTDRIRTNAAIRQGLANATSAQDARDWLACFGSATEPESSLACHDIPALAFGPLPRLRHACLLGYAFRGAPARARAWLRRLEPLVSYDEKPGREWAVTLALSARGVLGTGVPTVQDMATFPVAFQQGMDDAERARANGDVDAQAPARWIWGSGNTRVDALVMVHAASPSLLIKCLDRVRAQACAGEQAEVLFRRCADLPLKGPSREAFGFVDGISQPAMSGTRRAKGLRPEDVVAAGELVLGYPDQRGGLAPSPTLRAACDPDHDLDDAGIADDRQRPEFAGGPNVTSRDLGRNGTYLVVRELAQNVDAFERWLDTAAPALHGADVPWHPGHRREWLAAKLVGRWRDGSALVHHPDEPASGWNGTRPAHVGNRFAYVQEDSSGARCPLGAHIRRANPRDALAPNSAEGFAAVQTHRLLRVGRSYRDPDGSQGLMFMCINASIERQFEFVQQRWLLNPSFSGLQDETDALLGSRHGRAFNLPGRPGRVAAGLSRFVTMRGGGYFFLPGRAALRVLAG
ncbi:Dyp-type peroxidase [Variovorax ureilyticus]|uniref:Dyp-type peroxidase n=1 Tax=Variovorax ureilyticus TaxID=1836198 RepID=UPI003D6797F5